MTSKTMASVTWWTWVGMFVGSVIWPAAVAAQDWVQMATSKPKPSPRRNAAAIYDPQGYRLILVGGRDSSGDLNDTWALDLTSLRWQRLATTDTPPSPRHTHNAVYDRQAGELLLWSGRSISGAGTKLHADVWGLDLVSLRWRLLATPRAPVPRYGTAAIFDVGARELVNFAGFTEDGRFDDTWRFNVDTRTWQQVDTTLQPGARCLHTAAYDAADEQMIIYGGQRGPSALADVWTFDLRHDTWAEAPLAPTGGRRYPVGAFDVATGQFMVFGGERGGEQFGDLWALSMADMNWQQITVDGDGPPGRDGAVMVYDPRAHRLVLFGGTGAEGHLNDTWILPLPPPVTAVTQMADSVPIAIALRPVYPNPFNGQTRIQLNLAGAVAARLQIYDLLGRRVRQWQLAPAAGQIQLSWDGTDDDGRMLASGVYLVQLRAGDQRRHRRVALIR